MQPRRRGTRPDPSAGADGPVFDAEPAGTLARTSSGYWPPSPPARTLFRTPRTAVASPCAERRGPRLTGRIPGNRWITKAPRWTSPSPGALDHESAAAWIRGKPPLKAWRDRDHPRRFLALFRVPVRLARRRHRRQHRRHVRRSVRSLRSRAAWRPLVLQKSRTVGWATRANRLPRLVSSRAVARASSSLTFWSSGTLGAPAHGRPVMAQASNGWRTTLRPAVATWLPRQR